MKTKTNKKLTPARSKQESTQNINVQNINVTLYQSDSNTNKNKKQVTPQILTYQELREKQEPFREWMLWGDKNRQNFIKPLLTLRIAISSLIWSCQEQNPDIDMIARSKSGLLSCQIATTAIIRKFITPEIVTGKNGRALMSTDTSTVPKWIDEVGEAFGLYKRIVPEGYHHGRRNGKSIPKSAPSVYTQIDWVGLLAFAETLEDFLIDYYQCALKTTENIERQKEDTSIQLIPLCSGSMHSFVKWLGLEWRREDKEPEKASNFYIFKQLIGIAGVPKPQKLIKQDRFSPDPLLGHLKLKQIYAATEFIRTEATRAIMSLGGILSFSEDCLRVGFCR